MLNVVCIWSRLFFTSSEWGRCYYCSSLYRWESYVWWIRHSSKRLSSSQAFSHLFELPHLCPQCREVAPQETCLCHPVLSVQPFKTPNLNGEPERPKDGGQVVAAGTQEDPWSPTYCWGPGCPQSPGETFQQAPFCLSSTEFFLFLAVASLPLMAGGKRVTGDNSRNRGSSVSW